MKKIAAALIVALGLSMGSTPVHAATYNLSITVFQSDGFVHLYEDEDQSQQGGNAECSGSLLLWNPEPVSVSTILTKARVNKATKVKVLGSSRQTVGLGTLSKVAFVKTGSYDDDDPEIGFVVEGLCKFSQTINVKASDFYTIVIPGHPNLEYSLADLKRRKWRLSVDLAG